MRPLLVGLFWDALSSQKTKLLNNWDKASIIAWAEPSAHHSLTSSGASACIWCQDTEFPVMSVFFGNRGRFIRRHSVKLCHRNSLCNSDKMPAWCKSISMCHVKSHIHRKFNFFFSLFLSVSICGFLQCPPCRYSCSVMFNNSSYRSFYILLAVNTIEATCSKTGLWV